MSGVDTVRGIAYQQAQAVLAALDVLDDTDLGALRVEGANDVVDIELITTAGTVRNAKQVKTRAEQYTWSATEIVAVMRRWAALRDAANTSFEFVTDGRLGPTGEGVRIALEDAGLGQPQALADVLGEDANGAVCSVLLNARVRIDPVGVGALLLRAERHVAAMVPDARTGADANEHAKHAVDALFRLLFERGGDKDVTKRVITRDQIATTLGVPADQPASQRWPGHLRDRYLQAARALSLDAVVSSLVERQEHIGLTIWRLNVSENREPLDASTLLLGEGPVMLVGRTGTGKSTAAYTMCRDAAIAGRVVLMAHAETYLPGRLEALAADAASDLLGEDLPFATGKQMLADRSVTLLIDGISEVPESVQNALRDNLRVSVAVGRGARIVVLGRDVAALRAVLPSSVTPASYLMADLDRDRRLELASRTLPGRPVRIGDQSADTYQMRTVVTQVEHALGDAAGNPLLFTMGLALVTEGIPFTSRATLYERFVERLAARSGATSIVMAAATLGIVYAGLLDQGRRYADPYEWAQRVAEAAAALEVPGSSVDPGAIDDAARRSGLVNPIGFTQVLAPMHDSFADYLAGAAHARGLSSFPTHLLPGDDQRILFAAELGGVDAKLAGLVARDVPFLSVRLAELDRRSLTEDAPWEVEALLCQLLPEDAVCTVGLWRIVDGRVGAMRRDHKSSAWIDEAAAKRARETNPTVVIEDGGPMAVAVRLWRQHLLSQLRAPQVLGACWPRTQEEARSILTEHAERTADATAHLIDVIAPSGHASILTARVGPTGLSAEIYPAAVHGILGVCWPVTYRRTEGVHVITAPAQSEESVDSSLRWESSQSSVEAIVGDAPEVTAAERVRDAIVDLTKPRWL